MDRTPPSSLSLSTPPTARRTIEYFLSLFLSPTRLCNVQRPRGGLSHTFYTRNPPSHEEVFYQPPPLLLLASRLYLLFLYRPLSLSHGLPSPSPSRVTARPPTPYPHAHLGGSREWNGRWHGAGPEPRSHFFLVGWLQKSRRQRPTLVLMRESRVSISVLSSSLLLLASCS